MKKKPEAYFQQSIQTMPSVLGMKDFDREGIDRETQNIKKKEKLIAKKNMKLKK